MRCSDVFRKRLGCSNAEEVFQYLIRTLKDTITTWDYFVNWAKVFGNVSEIEMDLNTLNYLVGKDDIEREFDHLLERHPSIARLVPILVACRECKIAILTAFDRDEFKYETYDFSKRATVDRQRVIAFAKHTGFLALLQDKRIKSIVDYVLGVEVGLDSNARKNRGGDAMETIVEFFIKEFCDRHGLQYIREATAANIRQQWGLSLRVDKSSRRVDFVINKAGRLYLIETNFYSVGGSKLKSTAGEYIAMFDFWKAGGHEFVWVTDGDGWRGTHLPLRETFNHTDYILNLEMVAKGVLEDIVCGPQA